MTMIILRLEGGLGNQLFQYAFARTVQHKYGGKIILDSHAFKNDTQRNLSLHHFFLNNDIKIIKSAPFEKFICFAVRLSAKLFQLLILKILKNRAKRIKLLTTMGIFIQEDSIYLDYLFPTSFPIKYISGNWMSEKYFLPIREKLKEDLIVKTELLERNKQVIAQLESTNSVCIHIRRGDYACSTWADKLLVCDFEYYEKALCLLNQSLATPTFYVFSNTSEDIQWIKENYKFSVPVLYISLNNPDYEEFRLMMNCKHFILSNSSFSWWASYLSSHKNKMVVAPSKWNSGIWDVSDIYLPNWQIIEV